MFNFSELKNTVAELVQRSDDTNYKTKIGIWLNLSQDLLADSYDYFNELVDIYNFTTVDGRQNYPLPNRFIKPLRLFDLTNTLKLSPKSEMEYYDSNLASIIAATKSTPDIFRIFGISGTLIEISTSGKTVKAKSSSASDTAIVVRVGGFTDSAMLIEEYENITVTGTSYVAGTKTFYKIISCSKSGDSVGYITLADSDGTVLEYLSPTDRVARHKILRLGLIPNAANSMRLLYKKSCIKMVSDYDYPFTESDNFLVLRGWGIALGQEKETIDKSIKVMADAKQAWEAIVIREMGKLGPDYQNKLNSIWSQAHRQ